MDDHAPGDEDTVLSVRLDLHLDREPVCGRLRTEHGADERFVGWLGFVDALKRLHELETAGGRASETPAHDLERSSHGASRRAGLQSRSSDERRPP